jgi:asparagine N-glycosylation enzyme membrane subunit Stt3
MTMTDKTEGLSPHSGPAPRIGWLRAIVTAVGILVVGVAVLVYATNAVIIKAKGLNHGNRVGIATTLFFVALIVLAVALRQLQRRNLI